jgi:hypothetical protein
LIRGRYDVLVVGRGFSPKPHVREQDWARSARFTQVASSDRFIALAGPSFSAARPAVAARGRHR